MIAPLALGSTLEQELVAALHQADPDEPLARRALRRYVAAQRSEGARVEVIVSRLRALLARSVEPSLPPSLQRRVREAVLWGAIGEFYHLS